MESPPGCGAGFPFSYSGVRFHTTINMFFCNMNVFFESSSENVRTVAESPGITRNPTGIPEESPNTDCGITYFGGCFHVLETLFSCKPVVCHSMSDACHRVPEYFGLVFRRPRKALTTLAAAILEDVSEGDISDK